MTHQDLVDIAKPIVWRRGYQAGLSIEDREDLLQDVLLKYLRAWPDGTGADNVAAWFETATSNAIVDRVRAVDRRPADNFAEGGDDPLSLAIAAMRSHLPTSAPAVRDEVLNRIFALIPREDARLLKRRYLHHHTAAELAQDLGITIANVDQRTTRAKRRLRAALATRPDLVDELRAPHPHAY